MNEIYLITNDVNGKKYVGVTCRGYLVRFQEHLHEASTGKRTALYHAIRKYGSSHFSVKLIEDNIPDDLAEVREVYYIQQYQSLCSEHGYNMTEGGGGIVGYHHTEESKRQISQSLQGHVFPKSRNEKIREAMTGRVYLPEWKEALSKSRLGRFTQEENPFFGKHHTLESKSKVSKANTKHSVEQFDLVTGDVIQIFQNTKHAGDWVVAQGLTTAKSTTCEGRIGEVCRKAKPSMSAYGYGWRFSERSID